MKLTAILAMLLWGLACAAAPAPAATLAGEAGNYWVFFSDKAIESDAHYAQLIEQTAVSFSSAAIERRLQRGTQDALFGYSDLPVAYSYVDSVLGTGATLRNTSNWLNAASVTATPEQLAAIGQLTFVDSLRPVAVSAGAQWEIGTQESIEIADSFGTATFYGTADAQLDQINIQAAHALGYTGAGVTIGVLDTGFRRTHQAFNEPGHVIDVIAEYDFINNDGDTSETTSGQHTHGTYILGVMGGYKPNIYVGGAYDASFLLAKTEDVTQEVPAEEDDWIAGLEWLELNGADLVTSSLGYLDWYLVSDLDGDTALATIAADLAAANGLPVINAAGNFGHPGNKLIAPADGDLVITVGAVDSAGVIASFSSSGPTADGRIKPEVVARGVGTATVNPSNNSTYSSVNGTSLSTPLVAATVALMLQANPTLSVEEIRNILFSTADRAHNPDIINYYYGYGLIDAEAAVLAAEAALVPEPASLLLVACSLLCLTAYFRRLGVARPF